MIKTYNSNSLPNVNWKYYIYDSREFYNVLKQFEDIASGHSRKLEAQIVDTLYERLDKDYESVLNDKEILDFAKALNISHDPKVYINLYYTLAKNKLLKLKNSYSLKEENEDEMSELFEYYLRFKASAFFKKGWFYFNKYFVSDDFFKFYISDEGYDIFYNPSISTEYVRKEMYLNVILGKEGLGEILKKVYESKVKEDQLSKNDLIFVKGIRGVTEGRFLITYKVD